MTPSTLQSRPTKITLRAYLKLDTETENTYIIVISEQHFGHDHEKLYEAKIENE